MSTFDQKKKSKAGLHNKLYQSKHVDVFFCSPQSKKEKAGFDKLV